MPSHIPGPSPFSPDAPIRREDLEALFTSAEKPETQYRIGAEAEKIGVSEEGARPLPYAGPRGVERIFEYLIEKQGWAPDRETEDGPVIALTRGGASITLEPGAQLELSGTAAEDIHAVADEMRSHLEELAPISRELGIAWLGVGFHPFAQLSELPWVPKQRYGVMRKYLPERGARGLDMMQRTATVQANFDYSSEADAMTKLVVLLRFAPVVHAMTANAPFIEGRISESKSERGDVWLHMDPARSGLIPSLWKPEPPTYSDYVEWALDAGMFLFRRGDRFIRNTGQTFRDFLASGFEGHRATYADWVQHVNSLFPEARLKRTLEMRCADMLPFDLSNAVPALLTGLLYDAAALDQGRELAARLSFDAVEAARPSLLTRGLSARIGTESVQNLAERLVEIAEGGLERRARLDPSGRDERIYLGPLKRLVEKGRSPADEAVTGLDRTNPIPPSEILRRTRIG